jgi:glycine cleavage system H protein
MSKVPQDLKFTRTHEWVRIEGALGRIGITDFAQHELGDVVFVELPAVGTKLSAHGRFGTIESVKAASDLFSPVSGEVIETNASLADAPELVNDEPYGQGWMLLVQLSDPSGAGELMDSAGYQQMLSE